MNLSPISLPLSVNAGAEAAASPPLSIPVARADPAAPATRFGPRPEVLAARIRDLPADPPNYPNIIGVALAAVALASFVVAACGGSIAVPLAGLFGFLAILPGAWTIGQRRHPGLTLDALIAGAFCVVMCLSMTWAV